VANEMEHYLYHMPIYVAKFSAKFSLTLAPQGNTRAHLRSFCSYNELMILWYTDPKFWW